MIATAAAGRARQQLDGLRAALPEWSALLDLWAAVLDAETDARWAALRLLPNPDRQPGTPRLTGATVELPAGLATAWLARLGVPAMPDPLSLLTAAIDGDESALVGCAGTLGLSPDRLATIASIAVVPLLTRAAAQLGPPDPWWDRGTCPDCGAPPAMAEERGLERERRLRCLRCGGDWPFDPFRCPFCDTQGHRHAGSLAPETDATTRRVATCAACRGYVKTMTTLRAWSPVEIALADLSTVDLDLAAIDRGFARPATPPPLLGLTLVEVAS